MQTRERRPKRQKTYSSNTTLGKNEWPFSRMKMWKCYRPLVFARFETGLSRGGSQTKLLDSLASLWKTELELLNRKIICYLLHNEQKLFSNAPCPIASILLFWRLARAGQFACERVILSSARLFPQASHILNYFWRKRLFVVNNYLWTQTTMLFKRV